MDKVVSIYRKRFLGEYSAAQGNELVPDYFWLSGGIFLTTILPTIIYCTKGGPVSPPMFAGTFLTGALLGLVKYKRGAEALVLRISRAQGEGDTELPKPRKEQTKRTG